MARIQEYNSNIAPDLTVSTKEATGVSYGAGLEQLGQSLGTDAKDVIDINSRQQITKANVQISKNALDLETQISNQKSSFDPTQPDAREQYMKGFDDANKAVLDGIDDPKAQQYAQELIDRHVANYWNMALHKNAQIQGQETVDMVNQKLDTDSQAVYQQPGVLQQKIDDWNTNFVPNLAHGLGSDDPHIEKIRQDSVQALTKSAAKGAIQRNPHQALQDLTDIGEDSPYKALSGNDVNQLQKEATTEIRAQKNQQYYDTERTKNILNQTQTQNHQTMLMGIHDGTIQPTDVNKAFSAGLISEAQASKQHELIEKMIDGSFKDDAGVTRDAERRLNLPDGDPNKITDFNTLAAEYSGANASGKGIGKASLNRMAEQYLSQGAPAADQENLKKLNQLAESKLIQPTAVPWGDRQGMANWAQSVNAMHDQYKAGIKAGISPSAMFDPNSKDYLGKTIDTFKRTPSQMSAQATYQLHGPGAYNPAIGTLPVQPIGTDPTKAPIAQPTSKPTLNAKEQAFLDAIKTSLPPARTK